MIFTKSWGRILSAEEGVQGVYFGSMGTKREQQVHVIGSIQRLERVGAHPMEKLETGRYLGAVHSGRGRRGNDVQVPDYHPGGAEAV